MAYCINLKKKTKNGSSYAYCTLREEIIELKECQNCINKRYKQNKLIKKVSKKREFVQPDTYKSTYDRDKGQCVLCGKKEGLHLHHIFSRGKDKTNNLDNCVMLCSNCHLNIVHKNLKKYRPMLEAYINSLKTL